MAWRKSMGRIRFTNANLLDGENPAKSASTVVVDGEQIVEAGPAESIKTAGQDRVVDCKSITCGLWTHLQVLQHVLAQLIVQLGKKTGHPIVLNTSFNLKGEPIVGSPVSALATFMRCGIDVLYLDTFRIDKSDMRGLDRVSD